ncbi:MAG: hypothetical protein AABZ67_14115 [Pseudomonadota bacterium]
MINWFGRNKPEHPLADSRKVNELVASLPTHDGVQALEEIAKWLDTMSGAGDLTMDPRFRNLDLLDAASSKHEHAVMQEYLGKQRQKKSYEQRLWMSAHGLWLKLGDGYLQCLQQYDDGEGVSAQSTGSLPVIVGRAMRALRQQLKWVLLRYGAVEPRIWEGMARLYQYAESKSFADEAIAIFPGSSGSGTIKQEYLKALMLFASSTESLQPASQDLAVRLVAHFGKHFVLEDGPYVGCTHWVDLAAPKAPVRMVSDIPDLPTVCFIGAGEGLHSLEQLRAHIAYTRSLPDGLDLGDQYDLDMLLSLLKHLEQDWAGKTQSRRFERRKVATRITVVPGLHEILRMLEFANNDSLDFTILQAAESWIVEDMSDGGYGAVIPSVAGDWVEVGSLIGVEGETFRDWRIGVIRRVTRHAQQQRVGVQTLGNAPEVLGLESRGKDAPLDLKALRAKFGTLELQNEFVESLRAKAGSPATKP